MKDSLTPFLDYIIEYIRSTLYCDYLLQVYTNYDYYPWSRSYDILIRTEDHFLYKHKIPYELLVRLTKRFSTELVVTPVEEYSGQLVKDFIEHYWYK